MRIVSLIIALDFVTNMSVIRYIIKMLEVYLHKLHYNAFTDYSWEQILS